MKKLFGLLLIFCLLVSCQNQTKEFEIKVTSGDGVELTDSSSIAVTYRTKVGEQDSTFVFKAPFENGVAVVKGVADDIFQANLFLLENIDAEISGRPIANFYLENEKYNITLTSENERIKAEIEGGGELQKVSDSLSKEINKIYEASNYNALREQYMQDPNNKEVLDSLKALSEKLGEQVEKVTNDYILANPTSIFALNEANRNRYYISTDSLKSLVNLFAENQNLNKSQIFTTLKETLAEREAVSVGAQAPDFTLNDPDGNPVTLSEVYKENKITMIDFWASWCGPCRRFNPTLTQIYAKFKDKGFGILGVSLDREKEPWLKAIAHDKLVWKHVSDLAFWDCAAAKLYAIKYIPQSYFVDSEGKIVLASPDEEEIEKFLEENLQ